MTLFSITLALAMVAGVGLVFASLRGYGLAAGFLLCIMYPIHMIFGLLIGGCFYYFYFHKSTGESSS